MTFETCFLGISSNLNAAASGFAPAWELGFKLCFSHPV
ncbi:hypothetical protein VCHC59A1_3544 [Vibrio cholerae HC-59A1]|nr:hypothetical protein VCHC55A1_3587 [Vibrio cholerae HC-55A1]EKL18262.1 hypothetical protein VCHC59A1_3544 [Vibrio cholerae HC-59A1]